MAAKLKWRYVRIQDRVYRLALSAPVLMGKLMHVCDHLVISRSEKTREKILAWAEVYLGVRVSLTPTPTEHSTVS